jgi:hypothetical protein
MPTTDPTDAECVGPSGFATMSAATLYRDTTLGGVERWFLGEPRDVDVTIPDEIRKCVGFVGFQMADGSMRLAGTVFFVSRQVQGMDRMFVYAVTAKHVIQKIKDKGIDAVLFRLNVKGSTARWAMSKMQDWHFHADPTVDVALMRFGLTEQMDHKVFPIEGGATNAVIASHQIGIGDEVFLAGLFSPHYGKKNNIPIVRVGNIAAMPQEKVIRSLGRSTPI